jgi:hypothetical protein
MAGIFTGRARGLLLGLIATALLALATAGSAQAFSITSLSLTPTNANSGSPSATQASSHPDVQIDIGLSGDADLRNLTVHLPPGLLGNPNAAPKCTESQFNANACPASTQVGSTSVDAVVDLPLAVPATSTGQVYNLAPQGGEPARLGIHVTNLGGVASSTNTESVAFLRTAAGVKSDFGIDSFLTDLPHSVGVGPLSQEITITHMTLTFFGIVGGKAFMTTPSACIAAPISASGTSWGGASTSASSPGYTPTGCSNVPFAPNLEITPATSRTETPSAFQLAINFPTNELPLSQSTGHAADIRLPPGVVISPGVANGLQFCSDKDFGIDNGAAPNCPAGSVLGDTTFFAASLGRLDGQVFEGDPQPGHQIRLLTVVQQGATRIKFLDNVTPDPNTGQILNEYHDVGQLPFTRFEYRFRGGDNPALITPSTCGLHSGTSLGTPWLGAPDFRQNITGEASFTSDYDGHGAPCPNPLPFSPGIATSLSTTQAAASPALSVTLTRPDRQQLIKNTTVHMPSGLLGKLTGMTLCDLADAKAGTCPASTLVGSATSHVGAASALAAFPGKVYLTEPPNPGNIAGLSIVIPAVTGPLNFGNVVAQAAITLRQGDFGLDVVTTDFPRFQQGIPVLLRDITITVDKKGFLLNPTGCDPRSFNANFNGYNGSAAVATSSYQATGCDKLDFRPALATKVGDSGSTKKGGHPPFSTVLTVPPGDAANKKVTVTLPTDFAVNLAGLTTLCTGDQINARACPEGAKVGAASASSPLLPGALSGAVYIVQTKPGQLPKLAFYLDNPLLSLRFDGIVSLTGGNITTIFDNLPDVPLDRFQLSLNGGPKGTLTANSDLCAKAIGLDAEYVAHSGKVLKARGPIEVNGCTAAERRALTPSATATLSKRSSTKPELRVVAKKAKNGVALKTVKVVLPSSLKGSAKAAKKGLRVTAAGKRMSRKSWKVTGKSMTISLPKTGKSTVILIARKGAVKPSKKLRTAKKAPKLKITVALTDTDNRKFSIRVPVKLKK